MTVELNTLGNIIKATYEGESDTNAFTDAEKTKLSNIEDGATADQTGAEIKAAYEGEANTNAFTDAEKTKLSNIEANADVSPVTSVAGEVGVISASDLRTALNVEDGATADQTGAEIKAAYEGEANTNAFTDAEKTKLSTLNQFMPIEEEAATSYAAIAADAGKYKRMTAGSAVTFTITNGIFTTGDEIIVEQAGAGVITFTAGGSMTINSRGGVVDTAGQYAFASLKFITDSVVILGGDLV